MSLVNSEVWKNLKQGDKCPVSECSGKLIFEWKGEGLCLRCLAEKMHFRPATQAERDKFIACEI